MVIDKKHVLRRMAEAAKAIYQHTSSCAICPGASSFGTIIAPIGCCQDGRRIWKLHRRTVDDLANISRRHAA